MLPLSSLRLSLCLLCCIHFCFTGDRKVKHTSTSNDRMRTAEVLSESNLWRGLIEKFSFLRQL